jgi:MFS family permease
MAMTDDTTREAEGEGAPLGSPSYEVWRLGALALIAVFILIPVTLPVPVLRELVQHRFDVSEFATSLFMSINMIGAALAAPLAGVLADRYLQRPRFIAWALAVDALCFWALTLDVSFPVFMAIRFFEGCAHIVALSLLLGLAHGARPEPERGLAMGLAGGGLLLGVAIGAPIGGVIGRADPTQPLLVGAALLVVTAVLARTLLRETRAPAEARASLADMVGLVKDRPLIAAPLAFAFADRFTVGFFTTTFSLYLTRIHGLEPAQVGLLIAAFMLPFALLSVPLGLLSRRVSVALLLCGGSAVYGLAVGSLTFWPPGVLVFLMAATGTLAAVMFVPSMLMTTELSPERLRTTSLGAFNAAGSLGFIAGPLVGGFVSQAVAAHHDWLAGYRAAFLVAGVAEIVLAASTYPALRRFERERPAEAG